MYRLQPEMQKTSVAKMPHNEALPNNSSLGPISWAASIILGQLAVSGFLPAKAHLLERISQKRELPALAA